VKLVNRYYQYVVY